MNVVQNVVTYFLKKPFTLILQSTLRTPKGTLSVTVVDLNSICISHLSMHPVCLSNLASLYLFIPIIFFEVYSLWNFWLCNSLNPPLTFFLLSQDIPVSSLFPNNLNLWPFLRLRNTFSYTIQRAIYTFVHFNLLSWHSVVGIATD
jgi:hypothetical protein